MKLITSLKAILFGAIAFLMVYIHDRYIAWASQFALPEKLAPVLYRVVIAFCVVEAVRLAIIAVYRPSNAKLRKDNFIIGISHLSKVFYGLLAVVLILSLFNISVKEAITSLSLIAAAIVLMTKDYISNLINGMYMTFAKVINIGDQVQIEEHKGRILDITLTNVHLLNDDDDIIYIPNNKVFTSEIINYTRRQLKRSSVDFEIEARHAIDADSMQQLILNALGDLNNLIQPGTQNLKVQSVKHQYVAYKFQFILRDPLNKEEDKKVRRHVIRFIVRMVSQFAEQDR